MSGVISPVLMGVRSVFIFIFELFNCRGNRVENFVEDSMAAPAAPSASAASADQANPASPAARASSTLSREPDMSFLEREELTITRLLWWLKVGEQSTSEVGEQPTSAVEGQSSSEVGEQSTSAVRAQPVSEDGEQSTSEIGEQSTSKVKVQSANVINVKSASAVGERSTAEIGVQPSSDVGDYEWKICRCVMKKAGQITFYSTTVEDEMLKTFDIDSSTSSEAEYGTLIEKREKYTKAPTIAASTGSRILRIPSSKNMENDLVLRFYTGTDVYHFVEYYKKHFANNFKIVEDTLTREYEHLNTQCAQSSKLVSRAVSSDIEEETSTSQEANEQPSIAQDPISSTSTARIRDTKPTTSQP